MQTTRIVLEIAAALMLAIPPVAPARAAGKRCVPAETAETVSGSLPQALTSNR